MIAFYRKKTTSPFLGIYFGIFASAFISLFLTLLIFQQLGVSDVLIRMLAFVVPLILICLIGVGSFTSKSSEYFAAGRAVSSVYCGLTLALSGVGGTGIVIIPGLLFINGFDAWCLPLGIIVGFVVMGTTIAPYYRKYGAYTTASYLGWRFKSKLIHVFSAIIISVPLFLVTLSEINIALYATEQLIGFPSECSIIFLCLVLTLCIISGGMRALSSVGPAQAISTILAIIIPTAILGIIETNFPFAQLSFGSVFRSIELIEATQQINNSEIFSTLNYGLAGQELTKIKGYLTEPYSSLSIITFTLTTITVMLGVASSPWLLLTSVTTGSVYETRKSFSWTVFFVGFIVVTLCALAMFLRQDLMLDLIGKSVSDVPAWFEVVKSLGYISVNADGEILSLSNISFDRDGVLLTSPLAGNMPIIVYYLVITGVICASLAAAGISCCALATTISEDIITNLNLFRVSSSARVVSARITTVITITLSVFVATVLRNDSFQLLLCAYSICAAALFPVLVLSIWWKRINVYAVMVSITVGFGTCILTILTSSLALLPSPTPINGLIGIIPAFITAIFFTMLKPKHSQSTLAAIREFRIPRGETIYDRDQSKEHINIQSC
ncbi:MAG TPA: Cation/acetate symporter ActP [Hyphomicrobiaceae bacterium MAG_BT-2024]